MKKESILQRNIINFLITPESQGGLGYEEKPAQSVNSKLVIPSVAKKWLSTGRNEASWNKLLKSESSDEWQSDLIDLIQDRISKSQSNIAEFFLRNKTICYKNHDFYLYVVSDNDNEVFLDTKLNKEENIFTVVEEVVYQRDPDGKSSRRPDLCFFINGFYFSYLELKNLDSSGTQSHGISKILFNYQEAHRFALLKEEKSNDYRHIMQLWSQPCSILSIDNFDGSVVRNLHYELKKDARSVERNTLTPSEYLSKGTSLFKEIPVQCTPGSLISNPNELSKPLVEILKSYYSKHSIYNEISYYNFVESGAVEKSASNPISPRPKQKMGVDKTIERITQLLKHEKDENFLIDEILQHETVSTRNSHEKDALVYEYKNIKGFNKVNSILLQYSAGFGKTNIIAWLAGRMRNLRWEGKPAFDKVFLVADRLDLKDQLFGKLQDMPGIDGSSFVEVKNKEGLVEAINSVSKNIIIINIQKFRSSESITKLLREAKVARENKRYAFVIDEVHRSNSGDQHQNMMNVFTDAAQTEGVKNLIIGLTATPSEEVLTRFGSFHSYKEKRCAFDAFTMKEAIAGGFVLNPLEGLVKPNFRVLVKAEKDEIDTKTEYYDHKKEHIYENVERAKVIAEHSTRMMFGNIFDRIRPKGQTSRGKAMFACYSVKAAQNYYQIFSSSFKKAKLDLLRANGASEELIGLVKEDKRISEEYMKEFPKGKRKDILKRLQAKVYVVYTNSKNSQDSLSKESHVLCGFSSEKEVIKDFKSSLNGIMIVVKKLQTGFDDPNLHTLFLDRNIKDIEAVQTCCRVNRTSKGKVDCLVIDWTHENDNIEEITDAFRKYEGLTVSGRINATNILTETECSFSEMSKDSIVKELMTFAKNHSGQNLSKEFMGSVEDLVKSSAVKLESRIADKNALSDFYKEFAKPIISYVINIEKYNNVIDFPREHQCKLRLLVLKRFLDKLRTAKESKHPIPTHVVVDEDDLAFIMESIDNAEPENSKGSSGGGKGKPTSLSYIEDLNRHEMSREAFKDWYFEQRDALFDFIESNNRDFVNIIKSGGNAEPDLFNKNLKKIRRGKNKEHFDSKFIEMIDELLSKDECGVSTLFFGELRTEFELRIKSRS